MKFVNQDITTVERGIVVHGVNCMGEMNSGVALAVKEKWPEVYNIYVEMPTGKDMLGTTHMIGVGAELYVANCYTQFQFGYDGGLYADLESVEKCLTDCFAFADAHELPICAATIGSGRGGLDWDKEVEPIFIRLNRQYSDVPVTIYNIQE
jgi:O-acetyl-ADP-ribose deacetylase (regulator of RNase III)